ncbi:hypothetical protein IFM89_018204 [Coptis chinensis]|uniref:Protein kinase domain-containing protein n=1 Tax=Coptis chinensis TaxID=261450 RepID=A0A835I392_9MAGN|nr:hypothetical protein IFM89_018204 [Coptis chinensis]
MESYINRKMKMKMKSNSNNRKKLLMISRNEEEKVSSSDGRRRVVVGMKLDSESKELLTWALVKVAQSGDQVIALHILNNTEVVNGEGTASLLSLVKAFDSVLAVYEGFCNLKQVDLKLKICRGPSTRKVLVREAKAYLASMVIVGSSKKHRVIGLLSTYVARYCARKVSRDCSVLAVNNGKVVYQKEATKGARLTNGSRGTNEDEHSRKSLLSFHRSWTNNRKVLNNVESNQGSAHRCSSENSLKDGSGCSQTSLQPKCPICSSVSVLLSCHCEKPAQETLGDGTGDNSLALVPVETPEVSQRSVSLLIQDLPELRHNWPIHQEVSPNQRIVKRSAAAKDVSIVQWAMRLPSRYYSAAVHPDRQLNSREKKEDCTSNLDGESGAIVLVGNDPNPLASPDRESKNNSKENHTSSLDGESGAIVLVGNYYNPSVSPDRKLKTLHKELEFLHEKYSSTCRLFGYEELLSATSNFLCENLIGSGGSSQVYKGCLPDGKELAVKVLKPSKDILKEFVLEIEIITTLNHKNIVSLFGFCFDDDNLLLVYDFLSRGSLEQNLHGTHIIIYLFSLSIIFPVIILSFVFVFPSLSDFGLATWASNSTSHITCTDVAGTFGYLAPEYFMYGKLNDKVDVYAFGVVLLELLSGRKPISNENPKGHESLVMWAKPILNCGKIAELLDPTLGENYDRDQMERMVLGATLCIRRSARSRPGMNLVLKLLQGDAEVTQWSRLQVSALGEFDGFDEAVPPPSFQSHLNLALCDFEDDSLSDSSIEQNISVADYLQGRWSRSSSFD